MNPKLTTNVLIVVCLIGAGCFSHVSTTAEVSRDSTTEERKASFAPYVNAHIGQTTVEEFLTQRSPILSMFPEGGGGNLGNGYAVAIDRRGYYLTAAHCVQHVMVDLCFVDSDQPLVVADLPRPVAVVWSGDPDKPGSDLAILYVDSPPRAVFEWATEFRKGDVVFSIGRNSEANPSCKDFVAGKILDFSTMSAGPLRASKFIHDAPLHPGDSGGPLVAADGRLIAINYAKHVIHSGDQVEGGAAYRPDLAWLGKIINADSAMRTAEAKGDVDGAITAAGRVLDLDPKNVAALNQRGRLEDRKGDHDAAIANYNRATAIDPANYAAHLNRGDAEHGKP